eukprot:GGOE01065188.1.p4 GENE.GGOE01065188.1~~GGOE01065188.1.p4  ORF type:complete len:111 (-),score=3.00 GGOE01065188.1:29-361(-)
MAAVSTRPHKTTQLLGAHHSEVVVGEMWVKSMVAGGLGEGGWDEFTRHLHHAFHGEIDTEKGRASEPAPKEFWAVLVAVSGMGAPKNEIYISRGKGATRAHKSPVNTKQG